MKKFLVCPVCNSNEIEFDAGGYTGKYFCKKCGYIGSFVIEMTEEEYREFTASKQIDNK